MRRSGSPIVQRLNEGHKLRKKDYKFAKKASEDAKIWIQKRATEESEQKAREDAKFRIQKRKATEESEEDAEL